MVVLSQARVQKFGLITFLVCCQDFVQVCLELVVVLQVGNMEVHQEVGATLKFTYDEDVRLEDLLRVSI